MNRYSPERDLTASLHKLATGVHALRRCWACNQNKATLGGRLDKRTRLWRCAACVPKDER